MFFALQRFAMGAGVFEDALTESLVAKRTGEALAKDDRVTELVMELVSCVMAKERELKRELQAEGIEKARARGVKFGRTPLVRPEGFDMIRREWESGHISAREAARKLDITHSTFLKWAREQKAAEA